MGAAGRQEREGERGAPLEKEEEEAHRFRSIKFQKERASGASMPKSKSCHCLVSPILSWTSDADCREKFCIRKRAHTEEGKGRGGAVSLDL